MALFSFARAYFMVDMAVPRAYVQFLRSLMPRKPRGRDLQRPGLGQAGQDAVLPRLPAPPAPQHATSSALRPGIKGMVMLVFDLPSFPYVFKLIKD